MTCLCASPSKLLCQALPWQDHVDPLSHLIICCDTEYFLDEVSRKRWISCRISALTSEMTTLRNVYKGHSAGCPEDNFRVCEANVYYVNFLYQIPDDATYIQMYCLWFPFIHYSKVFLGGCNRFCYCKPCINCVISYGKTWLNDFFFLSAMVLSLYNCCCHWLIDLRRQCNYS